MSAHESPKFLVGSEVTWTSTSAGHKKTKTGTIIAIVGKYDHIKTVLENMQFEPCHVNAQDLALFDRYLVAVRAPGRKTQVYAPLIGALHKQAHPQGSAAHIVT